LLDFCADGAPPVQKNLPTPNPDATLEFANNAIYRILDAFAADHAGRVAGLGIALPLQLWDWADTLGVGATEMRGWKDRNIVEELEAHWDFPIFVCNDASTACGAELVFGDQNKPDDFLYFFVGFFIGGGLVLDHTLFTGRTGNAAALESMRIPTQDGSMRQLVDVASLATLEKALMATGDQASMIWDTPKSWDVPDAHLKRWLVNAAHCIAQAIVSLVCLIDV